MTKVLDLIRRLRERRITALTGNNDPKDWSVSVKDIPDTLCVEAAQALEELAAPGDWLVVLWAFPESVAIYGPMSMEDAQKIGDLYMAEFPSVTNVIVTLRNKDAALRDLPTKGSA